MNGHLHERGMGVWKEFKAFAIKGNMVDLAIGVVIGAAFGKVVESLVRDIVMPPISLLTGGINFENKFVVLKPARDGTAIFNSLEAAQKAGATTWAWGNFVTLLINFAIVAFAVFLVVKALNKMKRPNPASPPAAKDCPFCAMTIPVKAARCPHCTSELASR